MITMVNKNYVQLGFFLYRKKNFGLIKVNLLSVVSFLIKNWRTDHFYTKILWHLMTFTSFYSSRFLLTWILYFQKKKQQNTSLMLMPVCVHVPQANYISVTIRQITESNYKLLMDDTVGLKLLLFFSGYFKIQILVYKTRNFKTVMLKKNLCTV